MPHQLKLPELEEDRDPWGITLLRGRDTRGCPFRLAGTTSTPTRSPLLTVGALDLVDASASSWRLNFYQVQVEALLPYLFRFADTGRLHDAL